jgi:AcrR family transcriptional regulator
MTIRTRILAATSELIRSEGFSAVTTKKIAAEAGCAEGSIFRVFGDKGGLLAAVLSFGLAETTTLYEVVDRAKGSGDLGDALRVVADALREFYRASYPLIGSALADRPLFERYSTAHREKGTGPQQAWQLVHDVLLAHRDAGRVADDADLATCALLLAGACQNAAWVQLVSGPTALPHEGAALTEGVVATLLPVLTPRRIR